MGRAEEVVECVDLLKQQRLVTLTGVGGVGKTRLALAVATESSPSYPDGAWLCELAPVSDAGGVEYTVATALGVRPDSGQAPADAVVDWCRGRRVLLVLDNCEHVLAPVGRLVESILRSAEDVTVLATSREALAIEGEVARQVSSLADAAAVRLFSERAAIVRRDFTVSAANSSAIDDIVEGLDGLPLAIELAAARVASLTPTEIAARLGQRFRLLTGGRRTADDRQRTLQGAVEWSFGLLTPVEQRVFAHLSVFAGGCTPDAAEGVCHSATVGEDDTVLDVVESLARKSMVVVEQRDEATRYSMLETLRQYAEQRLTAMGEGGELRRSHVEYFATFAEIARIGLQTPDELLWKRRLDADFDNLRSAWQSAVSAGAEVSASRFVSALFWYGFTSLRTECGDWATVAVGFVDRLEPDLAAGVYAAASTFAWLRGDLVHAAELANAGVALPGLSEVMRGEVTLALMNSELLSGDFANSLAAGQASVARLRPTGAGWMLIGELSDVSILLTVAGRSEEALAVGHEALERARVLGNPTSTAFALYAVGEALLEVDPDKAGAFLTEAVNLSDGVGGRFVSGIAALSLTSALGRSGNPLQAVAGYLTLLDQWADSGNQSQQWVTLRNACELLGRAGNAEVVATVYGAMRRHGTDPPPNTAEGDRMARTVEVARAALDAKSFDDAMERGHMMSSDAVTELVREALRLALRMDESQFSVRAHQLVRHHTAVPLPRLLTRAEQFAFVGRAEERGALDAAWAAALEGERRVVLLAGEPGAGKTRLASEFATAAHDDGSLVLAGRCDEGLAVPYQPFVEALTELTRTAELTVADLGPLAGELVRLVPELAQRVPDLPPAVNAEPETERYRLFEAVAGWLAATPAVLVIEDLHWAAKPTLLMLRHLIRSSEPARLLVVATYRDTEVSEELGQLLADLRVEAGVDYVEVEGLTSGEVAELSGDLDAAALHAQTGGNPLFVGEVIRHRTESGETTTPESVRAVLHRRIERLPSEAIALLATAAVVGAEFDATLIATAAGISDVAALDALDVAGRAHLVTARGARWAFTHDLVRATVVDGLTRERRATEHRSLAEALEARGGGEADIADLAHHWCEAAPLGEVAHAVDYARRAGDQARATLRDGGRGGLVRACTGGARA